MHILYLGSSLLAFAAFSVALVGPGYLLAWWVDVADFRRAHPAERLLWSIALSSPLAILLSVYAGLLIGNSGVGILLLLLTGGAAYLFYRSHSQLASTRRALLKRGPTRTLVCVIALVCGDLLLAGAPVELHRQVFEGVASGDWSVRVPFVASAIRTGMPLVNPFYAVGGVIGPLRYYFYWYALAGVVGHTFALPARAILQAGAAWAALLLFSTLFLLLRHLFRPAPEWGPLRFASVCVGCVCAIPILGLDILQAIYYKLVDGSLLPEIEWWRAPIGFTPSFQTFLLYAPHHTFGICSGLLGFLLLLLPRLPGHSTYSRRRIFALAMLAGLCFGAMAGTSSYNAVFLAIACVLLCVERLVRRDWWMLVCIAISGLVALPCAWECLHVVLGGAHTSTGNGFVHVELRGWTVVNDWLYRTLRSLGPAFQPHWVYRLLALPVYLLAEFAETGVFAFVLVHRVRCDLLTRRALQPEQVFQWLLVAALLCCALFLSSSGVLPYNDLGFHAGFALRVIAVLWSGPWIATLLRAPSERRRLLRTTWGKVALATALLGLGTQLWQVVGQRFLLMTDIPRTDGPFPSPPDLPAKYAEAYFAWQAVDHLLPPTATVLTNPDSPQRSMAMLYADRQLVAPEPNCMTAFGGSLEQCRSALPLLRRVFGQPSATSQEGPPDATAPQAACRLHRATAVLVSSDDPVWHLPASWVWMQQPIYDGKRERLYRCDEFDQR